MTKSDSAVLCFRQGFNCAQSVLSAFAPEMGLNDEAALRVAGAFGGGMGRTPGGSCGAVTGALMVIGLKHGKVRAGDDAARETTYALVERFVERFNAAYGSITCRELLGCDLSTPEGLKKAHAEKLTAAVCPKYIAGAVTILQEILQQQEDHR